VYGGIYYASYEGVTFTCEEEHLGRWSKAKRERERERERERGRLILR
jgi:hypothetical protein